MTREEAIKELQEAHNIMRSYDIDSIESRLMTALNMAIKALEQEPSVVFVKTEESNDNGTKYLNINVSDDEVKRNPDIVRLCSDAGILEYVKPKTGHWVRMSDLSEQEDDRYKCSHCGNVIHHKNKMDLYTFNSWCGRCGSDNGRRIESEPQESEDKE